MDEIIFELEEVTKTYGEGETLVHALDHVSLQIRKGEFSALVGPSGSGKSTLLNVMSGLDHPTSGGVFLAGREISHMSSNELSDFRRDNIGFIFQAYNLIPVLTVEENIEYVMLLQGVDKKIRRGRVKEILEDVGLSGKEASFPPQLSGGQQQRVAVARAMVTKPKIILADEPTANLDSHNGEALVELMEQMNAKYNVTFIFSTHDSMIMDHAKRLITIKDGKIFNDEIR